MFKKAACILISGKAGVGKSTSAQYISKANKDYEAIITPFAYGLKKIARESFGWNGIKDEKGRQLLIEVGQTARHYDLDFWVKYTFKKLIPPFTELPTDMVLVDDWRFPNELRYAREQCPQYVVYTLRVEAENRELLKGTAQYNDISETSLPSAKPGVPSPHYDFVVDNTKDYQHLYSQLDQIVAKILQEHVY
jgi:hypothetical protein